MKAEEKFFVYGGDNANYKAIKDWREDERPRERLMSKGAHSLSDSELLAILLGHGTRGISAVDVARNLLEKFGTIESIASRDYSEIKRVKGVGDTKAVNLCAAFELGRRVKSQSLSGEATACSPNDIAEYYIPRLAGERVESFHVLMLNSANSIFRSIRITNGILNSTAVHAREVFRLAISESAASIILLHNHPSGNNTPSQADIQITKQLIEAGETIDIKVLDHIIIAGDSYFSFLEGGII